MGLISGILHRSVENPLRPLTDASLITLLGGAGTHSGVSVNEKSAVRFIAVYRAVSLVSAVIAALPLVGHRGKEPVSVGLLNKPHFDLTPMELWERVMWAELLAGNSFSAKLRDGKGAITYLDPYDLGAVTPRRVKRSAVNPWGKEFDVRTNDWPKVLTPWDVLHIPGPGYDGASGLSPIGVARQGIGVGLAAEEFGARHFGSGSLIAGVLQTTQPLDQPQAEAIKKRWAEKTAGLSHAHEVAVLDRGLEWKQIGIPPKDAQFLECVTPDTRITLASGAQQQAGLLEPGDVVLGWDHRSGRLVPSRVAHVGDNGVHPLVRITTDRGRTLTTTENHPYLSSPHQRCPKCGRRHKAKAGFPQTWVRADELTVGDYVLAHDEKRARLDTWAGAPGAEYHPDLFALDRIKSVERLPDGPTVAIEVEGTNSHVTNGLITHNTRKFAVTDVARLYGIPPHLLGDVETSTSWGTGIEQQQIGLIVFTLTQWMTRVEQRVAAECLAPGTTADFDTSGLLRGDVKTRMEAAGAAIQNGIKNRNEVRAAEGLAPVKGGERFLVPSNHSILGDDGLPVRLGDGSTQPIAPQGRADDDRLREFRCGECGKLLVKMAAPGTVADCPRCKAERVLVDA